LLQRALVRLQQLGGIGSGTQEERLRRATLLLLSLITLAAEAVWGLSYWLMGFHDVALVPFAYTFIVLFGIIGFVVTERFGLFAWMQLGLLLLLPLVVQWQLGGFVPAGGVMLWSLLAAIGAFVFWACARAGRGSAPTWRSSWARWPTTSCSGRRCCRPVWRSRAAGSRWSWPSSTSPRSRPPSSGSSPTR
jgi:hypothetical protein